MAYEPSKRQKSDDLDMELDIRPVMNLMVVLIPLLIASAEWVKLSVIEIDVPPPKTAQNGGGGAEEAGDNREEELKLGLKIAISNEGITLATPRALLQDDESEGPSVPVKEDGSHDYELMREKLIEIKNKISDKGYKDENRVVLTAASEIKYQVIIDIMDRIQTYTNDDNEELPLFPEVNFSSIIQ